MELRFSFKTPIVVISATRVEVTSERTQRKPSSNFQLHVDCAVPPSPPPLKTSIFSAQFLHNSSWNGRVKGREEATCPFHLMRISDVDRKYRAWHYIAGKAKDPNKPPHTLTNNQCKSAHFTETEAPLLFVSTPRKTPANFTVSRTRLRLAGRF